MLTRRQAIKAFAALAAMAPALAGCSSGDSGATSGGVTNIEIVSYKQEATKVFAQIEDGFNATHDNIHLTISSPKEAMTVLKTRFVREDYPDIIGFGGDVNYSDFVEAGILADLSSYQGLSEVKKSYLDILDTLEYVPTDGTFGLPWMANAAGVLYNRTMFKQNGWEIPESWDEYVSLLETIKKAGIQPLYAGYKDTWTTLAPWNALAIELSPSDTCQMVNEGKTTFTAEYREVAEKMYQLLDYMEENPFAYGYNDACTAFAKGQSAMFMIGSYAMPQILSVNPDLDIDSFVMPGSNDKDKLVLNSGVDLQFSVMESCPNKDAAYEVLDYLLESSNIQTYVDAQSSVPCVSGDFTLSEHLDGMKTYIDEGKVADFQDHHYPSQMAVDAQIQTFLMDGDVDKFLAKFDSDWVRYNRDIIRKVQDYESSKE